jgi:hypothetical protein
MCASCALADGGMACGWWGRQLEVCVVCMCVCVNVCVCVRERESVCVCLCVCARVNTQEQAKVKSATHYTLKHQSLNPLNPKP